MILGRYLHIFEKDSKINLPWKDVIKSSTEGGNDIAKFCISKWSVIISYWWYYTSPFPASGSQELREFWAIGCNYFFTSSDFTSHSFAFGIHGILWQRVSQLSYTFNHIKILLHNFSGNLISSESDLIDLSLFTVYDKYYLWQTF